MLFLNAFFSASDACFCQCPTVSYTKIIASTARISRCRRSPRTTINKNTTKNRNLEKGRKRGGALLSFGVIFDVFLNKNVSKNRNEKLCRKTRQKNVKLSKKQGTIPPPKIKILKFLLQRRILQNSVFTREKRRLLKIPCFESVHTFEKHPRKK